MRPVLTLLRGFAKRCPLCGSGDLFAGWFRMCDRCPRCGHKFDRRPDDAFFLGAYSVNLGITLAALVVVMGLLMLRVSGAAAIPMPVLVGLALFAGVAVPVVAYPLSKTIWAAIDLVLHPQEAGEWADAVNYLESSRRR